MLVSQSRGLGDENRLLVSLGIKSQSKLLNLFRKGLNAGILSPRDVFSAFPVKAKRDETAAKEVLDWLFDCFEQLRIRIIPDHLKNLLLGLKNNIDETIEIFLPSTVREEKSQEVLGSVTFSLFKSLSISRENGDSQKELELRNKIVQLNLGLAKKWAKHWAKTTYIVGSIITEDDLFQEGSIGLIRAVSLFDYSKSFRFSTYAGWWIEQCIQRFLQNHSLTIRIPTNRWHDIRKLERVRQKLTRNLRREPLEEELKKELDWSSEKLQAVTDAIQVKKRFFSLDEPIGPGSDLTFAEVISFSEDREKIENSQFREELQKELSKILAKSDLSIREIYCFNEYFFSRRTYQKIGETLGLCRERVRQLIEKSLEILRKPEISGELINFK